MNKAVIYARYSSQGQSEQSIDTQIRVCQDYAEKQGLVVVDIYTDFARSGTNDKRPAFQKMIEDSGKGLFDVLIIYAINRFARNEHVDITYDYILKQNGVKTLSATEYVPEDDNIGSLYRSIQRWESASFSKRLSKVVKDAFKTALEQGRTIGTRTYGYDTVDKKYVVNEFEATIVKELFARRESGESFKTIAEDFDKRGIKNKRGNVLSPNALAQMIKNTAYIGIRTVDGVTYNLYPPIIDKRLFVALNKVIIKNKPSFGYSLSGKLKCGICGRDMVGACANNHQGNKYFYYQCNLSKRPHKCVAKSVRKEFLEDLVVSLTLNHVLDRKALEPYIDSVVATYNQALKDNSTLKVLKDKERQIKKSIKNIVTIMKKGVFSNALKTELSELELDLAKTQASILTEEVKVPFAKKELLFKMFEKMKTRHNDEEGKKIILDCFIEAVVLYENQIKIIVPITEKKVHLFDFTDLVNSGTESLGVPTNLCTNFYITKGYLVATFQWSK